MFLLMIPFIISLTSPDKTNIIILVKGRDSLLLINLNFSFLSWWLCSFVQGTDGQHFPMCGVFPFWTRIQQVMHIGYVKVLMGFDNHVTAAIDDNFFCDVHSTVKMSSKLREDQKVIWNLDSHR